MSKVDSQRAMREAKYARTQAGGPTRREVTAAGRPPAAPGSEASPAPTAPVAPAAPEAPVLTGLQDDVCGHRSMNGRACTRPAGHAEKNHRYG